MADATWQSTQAGRHLAGRKKRDTRPEMLLRAAVHARGLRYSVQKRLAKGCTPDIVLVRHRVAVFVDGCYWHQCPLHGRTTFNGPNASLWLAKMQRNKERDLRADEHAVAAGYRVVRLWECAVTADPKAAADLVVQAVTTQ
jgi:DNA mismatch endonuclease (patch repair protein)